MRTRLAQVAGSRVQGVVQIAEPALNDLLRVAAGSATAPSITVHPNNRVLVRYGVLHANAELPRVMDVGARPRLTVTLASVLLAWTLRAALHQPFVHVHGRHVTIDVANVPAFVPWRDIWPHVKALHISSARGLLQLHLALSIDGVMTHA